MRPTARARGDEIHARLRDLPQSHRQAPGQLLSRGVGRHAVHAPPVERMPDRILQVASGPVHGRLRDAQPARGLGGRACIGDGDVAADLRIGQAPAHGARAGLACPCAGRQVRDGRLDLLQQAFDTPLQQRAVAGQLAAAIAALEQDGVDRLLQLLDRQAHCGLAQAHDLGRLADAALATDCVEQHEAAQVDVVGDHRSGFKLH
jgi:hypothetical protein